MFEQFGNYSEVRWTACAAAQFIGPGDVIQINPDLKNFKLVRFKDLRKHSNINEEHQFKLMLIGSSKTNIFIDGPDSKIDEIISRLSLYKDKSWVEIEGMSLDKDFLSCKNALVNSLCDSVVLDEMELKPLKSGEPIPMLHLDKIDQICAKCKNFEFNPEAAT